MTKHDSGLETLIQQKVVKTEPLRMSRDQLVYIIRLGAARPVNIRDLHGSPRNITLCRPKSSFPRFRAEVEKDGRYMIFVRDESGKEKELEVIVSSKGERFVADMDPVIVGVPEAFWEEDGQDRPAVSLSRLDHGEDSSDSESDIQATMDPEFGNITPRAMGVFTRINRKLEVELIRHGPESLNPHAREENLFPCIVFNPGLVDGVSNYSIVNSVEDMSRLMEACGRSGIKIPPHPSWKRIKVQRRGSLYEAAIAKDLSV